jgi:hypothetical protein
MTCTVCGVETDANRDFCARCNADLRPPVRPEFVPEPDARAYTHTGPRYEQAPPYQVIPPHAASAPPMPPAGNDPSQRLVANVADGLICVLVLAVGLAIATWVARSRGGRGLTMITERLSWLHLVLAVVVLVVYRVGSRWIAGQTPGQVLAGRLAGSQVAARRPVVSAIAPAVIVAVLVSVLVGRAVPVGAAVQPNGNGSGAAQSAGPSPQSVISPTSIVPSEPVPVSAADDPAAQASTVDALLSDSVASRSRLRAALADLDRCVNATAAVNDLRQVTSQRGALLGRAQNLATEQLSGGGRIRGALIAALTHSVAADKAFTAWGQRVASGRCGHDGNYQDGLDASAAAQVAKKQFCAAWNPVAASFGLPQRTEAEL